MWKRDETNRSNKFTFWRRWLFYTSLLFAVTGFIIAFFPTNPLSTAYTELLSLALFEGRPFSKETLLFRNFISGPLGGTVCCSYLLLALIAKYPFKKKEKWAQLAIILPFGCWLILDSIASVRYGLYFQLFLVNGLSVVQKSLPLIFTWKDFSPKNGS